MTSWKHGAPRVAFISGGGSGIGLCLVKSLIREGANLAIFDLRMAPSVTTELQSNAGPGQKVAFYAADVTDPIALEAAMDKATSDMGPPDLAINSAGMMRNGEFTSLPYETFEQVVRVNLLGSRNFAAGALKHMHSGGHLVLIASLAGLAGSYTQSAYAASKFGVVGLAEVLRVEQKLKGIDVSVVCPGEISTPLLDYERAHGSRVTETVNGLAGVLPVDEAVAGILKGIRKREYMITPGFRAKMTRFLARKATRLMHWIVDQTVAKALAKEKRQG